MTEIPKYYENFIKTVVNIHDSLIIIRIGNKQAIYAYQKNI